MKLNCLFTTRLLLQKSTCTIFFVTSCWLPFLQAQDLLNTKENTIVSKKESAVTEQEAADNKQIKLALEKIGSKDYDLAIDIFQQLLKKHSNIKDYLHYNLAKAYLGKEQKEESKIQFTKVLDYSPNLKLMIDTHMQLGRLAKEDKKYKEAKKWFAAIEKRSRGQEIYAELIYNLAQVEFNAGSKETCKWARKLYAEFPHYTGVEAWGVDLRKNKFDDKEIKCTTLNTDIQKRLRRLDLVGKSIKAAQEIEQLKLLTTDLGISKYEVAKIEAGHWLHDGDVLKSIQILKSFEKEKESDPEYQMDLASLYSRSNELTQSAELYYNIFQKYRKSKWAKESLFQSAFLSYQTQNYSEAEKKFYEYQKLYGDKGGRLKDIKWYLGWCRYLSKDYRGAISQWEEILKTKSKKNLSKDKILYWKSMAHLRMGEVERAFNSLKELSDDKLLGYYSLLAQHRLQKIESLIPKRKLAIKDAIRHFARLSLIDSVIPEEEYLDNLAQTNGGESGISLANSSLEKDPTETVNTDNGNGEDTKNQSASELNPSLNSDSSDEAEDEVVKSNFANPILVKKFERAQDLLQIGLIDDMKWEYFEIEKRTSHREYLKILMKEYDVIENFHRSSYIAQTYFGQARAEYGIEGVRYLWEYVYPKAYVNWVDKYAKENQISNELIWSIMKAESQYKKDVISPVGALGLMQMMPYTADRLATLMNIKDFNSQKLFTPSVSIQFGAKYLSRLEKKFQGQRCLIAAAYNAGPHRVHNWLGRFGTLEMDEFVEHIPFVETRNYVKKVLTNMNIYTKLYGKKEPTNYGFAEAINVKLTENSQTKESWDEI